MSELVKAFGGTRAQERELVEQLVARLDHLATTTTDAMEMYAGRAINGVLDVQTQVFPTSGILGNAYGTPCGSLLVVNSGATNVTIVAGGGQSGGTAPPVGQGLTIVPGLSFLPVAIANTAWVAYGTTGAQLSWTAFTGLQAFGIVR